MLSLYNLQSLTVLCLDLGYILGLSMRTIVNLTILYIDSGFTSEPSLRIEPEKIDALAGGVARFQCQIDSASPKAPFCVWEHPRQGSHINR